MQKADQQTKKQAKHDFGIGMTVPDIAEKYGFSRKAVQRWYEADGWKEHRQFVKQKTEEALLREFLEKLVDNARQHIEASRLACRIALEITAGVYRDRNEGAASDEEALEAAAKLARIAKSTAEIQKIVAPEAQEEIMSYAIEQLEELKQIPAE